MKRYRAVPDYTTKNKSALHMAALYKAMGVKNYMFCLALIDQDLIGVDARDPTLDMITINKIAAECKRNVWYYFREVHRVPSAAGGSATPFRFDRANISLIWSFFNHLPVVLVAIRQSGKSTALYGLVNNLMGVTTTNTDINFLTLDSSMRERAIIATKEAYSLLPTYLQLRSRKAGDADNAESFTVLALGNRLRTFIGQKSVVQARKSGRGQTSPITLIDEGPYIDNIHISLEIAATSGVAAREIAAKNNSPYGTAILTTAGYKDTPEGGYIYNLMQKSAIFTESFFDAEDATDLEKIVRANSKGNVFRVQATYTHRMLGKTDEWLTKVMEESMVDDPSSPMALADFRGVWMSGSKTAFLSPEYLVLLNDLINTPTYLEKYDKEGYVMRWYINQQDIPARMDSAIMSIDTSEGIGNDDIVVTVICIVSGELLAQGTFNTTNIIDFSEYLYTWFVKYPKFPCIIESKSTGRSVLDYLLKHMKVDGINPFKRLFSTLVDDSDKDDRSREIYANLKSSGHGSVVHNIADDYRKTFGYPTAGTGKYARDELYGLLKQAIKVMGSGINDSLLVKQMSALSVKKGRIDHGSGEHDDAVVSYLLGVWFLMKGSNLDYYGITPGDVLLDPMLLVTPNSARNKDNRTDVEKYSDSMVDERQINLRKRILHLFKQLKGDNSIGDVQLELEIKSLESVLNYDERDGATYSLTAFKEKLKRNGERGSKEALDLSSISAIPERNPLMHMVMLNDSEPDFYGSYNGTR